MAHVIAVSGFPYRLTFIWAMNDLRRVGKSGKCVYKNENAKKSVYVKLSLDIYQTSYRLQFIQLPLTQRSPTMKTKPSTSAPAQQKRPITKADKARLQQEKKWLELTAGAVDESRTA